MFSIKSSPESTPSASMSAPVRIETGKAPVIFAPLIWLPVTTTSSTSSAENKANGDSKAANTISFKMLFILFPQKIYVLNDTLNIHTGIFLQTTLTKIRDKSNSTLLTYHNL